MAWIPPITNWGPPGQTSPGVDDLNRIEGNIAILGKYDRAPGYGTATGTNAKSIMLDPAPGSYYDGLCFAFKNETQNTGAVTINVNGMGAKPLKKPNGNDVTAGFLKAGSVYTVRYNGTNFILQGSDSAGDATPDDVRAGKTFSNDDGPDQVGTLPDRGNTNIQAQLTSDVTIPKGIYDGNGKVLRPVFSAGNNVQFAADNNVNESGTSYRRLRNIQIGYKGTFRVYWSLRSDWEGKTVWGRIYINGVPAGTERSTSSPTEVFYTENFTVNAGDRIELWMKATFGSLAVNDTFEIRTAEPSLIAELSPV